MLVILPLPLIPGSVIRCRPVGVLKMSDEAGSDEKLLAVPIDKVFAGYSHIDDIDKVSPHWLERIGHFFEHYKDLEKGKWVKLDGWGDAAEAKPILRQRSRATTRCRASRTSEYAPATGKAKWSRSKVAFAADGVGQRRAHQGARTAA